MPIPAALLLAFRMLGLSLACGTSTYATFATIGLASQFGWVNTLPPALIGLEQWLLINAAAALLLVEIVAVAIPWVEPVWEAVHTGIRPVAAATLTLLGLEGAPLLLRITFAILAGGLALGSHAARTGIRLSLPQVRTHRLALALVEALAAGLLALVVLLSPGVALAAIGLAAGVMALFGPPFWRAAAFAARAIVARVRGFFLGRDWHGPDELSPPFRRLLGTAETGIAPPRLVRAALTSRTTGPWRNGWLVIDRTTAAFFYRHAFSMRRIQLERPAEASVTSGFLADTLDLATGDDTFFVHLLKDGPAAYIVMGALQLIAGPSRERHRDTLAS